MNQWAEEHGSDYAVPTWISERYGDRSWKNDTSPSFVVELSRTPDSEETIILWVEHPDPDSREHIDNDRYTLTNEDATETLWSTEYEATLRMMLDEWHRSHPSRDTRRTT